MKSVFEVVEIFCTAIVLVAGSGLLLCYAALIWYKALDKIAWAFKGTKYMLAYAIDAEGRARAKKRVDSIVTVGTPDNPYPKVEP